MASNPFVVLLFAADHGELACPAQSTRWMSEVSPDGLKNVHSHWHGARHIPTTDMWESEFRSQPGNWHMQLLISASGCNKVHRLAYGCSHGSY